MRACARAYVHGGGEGGTSKAEGQQAAASGTHRKIHSFLALRGAWLWRSAFLAITRVVVGLTPSNGGRFVGTGRARRVHAVAIAVLLTQCANIGIELVVCVICPLVPGQARPVLNNLLARVACHVTKACRRGQYLLHCHRHAAAALAGVGQRNNAHCAIHRECAADHACRMPHAARNPHTRSLDGHANTLRTSTGKSWSSSLVMCSPSL